MGGRLAPGSTLLEPNRQHSDERDTPLTGAPTADSATAIHTVLTEILSIDGRAFI